MATPYVTPEMIVNAPTGISWNIIPFVKATSPQQLAEQTNMCWRATSMVDEYCNQPLRATIDTEAVQGPDYRMTIQNGTGNARIILSRWPVTSVLQVAVSPNSFPRSYQLVPSGYYEPEVPPISTYGSSAPSAAADGGQAILVGGGYLNRALGRYGYIAQSTYLNGWPHCSTTAAASSGTQTIQVDDVTGLSGAQVFLYDGAQTETATVTSVTADTPYPLPYGANTASAGPGTAQLTDTTTYTHGAGVVVSALPQNILWATILATVIQALESGVTAVTIPSVPGTKTVGGQGIEDLEVEWKNLLTYYRRTI
jgi:hypothetical protein